MQSTRLPATGALRWRLYSAHDDFLRLWKNADPEIPILKDAKAESAKLEIALRTSDP